MSDRELKTLEINGETVFASVAVVAEIERQRDLKMRHAQRALEAENKLHESTAYAGSCRRALCRIASLGESSMSDTEAIQAAMDIAVTALAKNPVNAEPSASTQSAGTTESALNPGPLSDARTEIVRPQADLGEAVALLALMYDAYEDGTPCQEYDEDGVPGSSLGNAFRLSEGDENRIIALLKRLDPRPADLAQTVPAVGTPRDGKTLAEAWRAWLRSTEGCECMEEPVRGVFLENRLWYAFTAGAAALAEERPSQGTPRAECIKECEAYLHGNGQGSICGLHKKAKEADRG